jgi:hypothetical protein
MIIIGVESKYRSVDRSLSGWGSKREPNAPITTGSEVVNFLRRRRSCSYSSGLLWNVGGLNWICKPARDEDVMLPHSGLSCPADWAWICSFWGGGALLVDHSTHTGSGVRAPICPTGSALQSDRAKVRADVECDLMKRSRILWSYTSWSLGTCWRNWPLPHCYARSCWFFRLRCLDLTKG